MNHLFLKIGYGLLLWCCCWLNAYAQTTQQSENHEAVEFDSNLLMPLNGQTVDVSRFRFGNPIAAGEYDSEIWVNGSKRGNMRLKFDDVPKKPMSGLCFTPELFTLLDLKKSALSSEMKARTCHDITQILPDAKSQFDVSNQRLNIELPSNLVVQRPRGYISPSQWQHGVPAAFVKYQFNQYQYRQSDDNRRSAYLGVQAGVNLGAWTVRHSGSHSWQSGGETKSYRSNQTYIQRDIDTWKSRMILGDFHTRSNVNENFSVRGISLISDTRMLPYSVTGYAPVVRGVANSNARVTVRQNGNIIHETNVAAGSFEINDLLPSGLGSDLHVEVLEADGTRREFIVPTAISSQILRPKHWRYEATIGRYREGSHVYPHHVAQASWQYGLSNAFTLKTGATASKNYLSAVLGSIYSNRFGSWEGDVQAAKLKQNGTNRHKQSISLAYNKNFSQTDTYLYAKWQKYLSNQDFGLWEAVSDSPNTLLYDAAPKHKYQVSLNQKLGEKGGNVYLSGSSTRHYGRSKASHEYQVGYSNHYQNWHYSFGFSQSRNVDTRRKHNQIYANLFVPLDNDKNWLNHHWLDMGYQKSGNDSLTRIALNGALGQDGQLSYGLSGSHQHNHKQNTYAASLGYRASAATFNVNTSRYGNGNQQWGFGASGAIVAHPRGITLSRELGETFAIIHAKHAKGASIRGASHTTLDRFGNGIVPHITPYRVNHVGINPDNLPDEVEVFATGKDIVPRAHSVNLAEFATSTGTLHRFRVHFADSATMLPIAAEAFDDTGKSVGFVGQGGILTTRGIADSGSLKIVWGNDKSCRLDYRIHGKQTDFSQPQTVQCLPIEP